MKNPKYSISNRMILSNDSNRPTRFDSVARMHILVNAARNILNFKRIYSHLTHGRLLSTLAKFLVFFFAFELQRYSCVEFTSTVNLEKMYQFLPMNTNDFFKEVDLMTEPSFEYSKSSITSSSISPKYTSKNKNSNEPHSRPVVVTQLILKNI